jgi:monoamine oxidase
MAALELKATGHDVVVLEARDRVGGRIHTVRFANGLWANAGAEWLNTTDVIAHELCQRYALELTPRFGFESVAFDGLLEDRSEAVEITAELDKLAASLADLVEPWRDPAARALDERSVAEWLSGLGHIDAATRRRYTVHIRGAYMVEPDDLSLAALVLEHAGTAGDRSMRFTMGTAALPAAMASELGFNHVYLNAPVLSIATGSDSITVSTTSDSYTVDSVIVAVPLPALHRIDVQPEVEFPWLGQGRGGKLLVPYRDRLWAQGPTTQAADCPVEFVYDNASHQAHTAGVLATYSMDVIDDEDVLAALQTWFPALVEPVEHPVKAWWSDEPESGTTYSAPRPGDLEALRRLREPFGRIYLAGEHTESMFGYVESALVSGRRVARLVDEMSR